MNESLTHKSGESRSSAMVLIWSMMVTSLVAPVKALEERQQRGTGVSIVANSVNVNVSLLTLCTRLWRARARSGSHCQ